MAFDLNPAPTFVCTVGISVPGGPAKPLSVRFRHKDKTQYVEFVKRQQDDREMVAEIVDSFLDKPDGMSDVQFAETLLLKYPASGMDLFVTYCRELGESRAKN